MSDTVHTTEKTHSPLSHRITTIVLIVITLATLVFGFRDMINLGAKGEYDLSQFTHHQPINHYTEFRDQIKKLDTEQHIKTYIVCEYFQNEAFYIDSLYFMYPDITTYLFDPSEIKNLDMHIGDRIMYCKKDARVKVGWHTESLWDGMFVLNVKTLPEQKATDGLLVAEPLCDESFALNTSCSK